MVKKVKYIMHTVFKLLKCLHGKGECKSKCTTKVKRIFANCGYSYLWDNYQKVNMKWVKHCIDVKLKDIDQQDWHQDVHRNRLCTNYNIFKNESGMEKYLWELCPAQRISLSKFRCGGHKLTVSVGWYLEASTPKPGTLCDTGDHWGCYVLHLLMSLSHYNYD